jgi:glycosyltransferase involved in cell wall biosynthesis
LLEAMGCANLIVAHDNPFNRETLGEAALFFEGTNDLKQTLERIEGTDFDASRMRSEAMRRASQVYSWPTIIEQYVNLLRSASTTFPEKATRAHPGWEMPA